RHTRFSRDWSSDVCSSDLGPTGVGKTELVRLLALAIHGKADAFCRIDMNTLAQEHYAAALTGAPPGYVGSKEGTTLFDEQALARSEERRVGKECRGRWER